MPALERSMNRTRIAGRILGVFLALGSIVAVPVGAVMLFVPAVYVLAHTAAFVQENHDQQATAGTRHAQKDQAYLNGMSAYIETMHAQFVVASPDHKDSIRTAVQQHTSGMHANQLSGDDETFLNEMLR